MFGSGCKRLQLVVQTRIIMGDSMTHLCFLRNAPLFLRSYSSKSVLVAEKDKPQAQGRSFTVSYLVNSCGLSPELALSTSKRVQFDTRQGPDSVLNLLKHHGFTDTHISQLVVKRPDLLIAKAQKTLLPKLEFFGSVGISGTDLARVICYNPLILHQSLERSIIPRYHVIKSLLLLDNVQVAQCFSRSQRVLSVNLLTNIAPNISFLRLLQVPEARISLSVAHHPREMCLETDKFKENVKKVMSMGFPPSSATFMKALYVITLTDASKWDKKMEVYRKRGWTEDDFLLAFRKNPSFMDLSDKNFLSKMDFLVNKMGWEPADVAARPTVLTYSLEKWIIPRCSVIKVLRLKGLIKNGELSLNAILTNSKEYFLGRFVIKYQKQVPELLSIFQGKMGLAELGLGFE